MIIVDSNVLVYAHRREAIHFRAANRLIRTLDEGDVPRAITWPDGSEFRSVVTNSRILGQG